MRKGVRISIIDPNEETVTQLENALSDLLPGREIEPPGAQVHQATTAPPSQAARRVRMPRLHGHRISLERGAGSTSRFS
jgi:hypothetical protein